MDLKKLRGSQQAQTAISSQSAANLANKYRFKGRHGDQVRKERDVGVSLENRGSGEGLERSWRGEDMLKK